MAMKKKVLTASLATSLIVGSVASIPVYATPTTPLTESASEIQDLLNDIYAEIPEDSLDEVRAARDAIKNLQINDQTIELIAPMWAEVLQKIQQKPGFETATSYKEVNQYHLLILMKAFAIPYDTDFVYLESIRNDEFYRTILGDFYELAGVEQGNDDILDLVQFIQELQEAALDRLTSNTSLEDILNAQSTVKAAIQDVLDDSETNFAAVLNSIGITDEAIFETKTNLESVTGSTADRILAMAYLKVLLEQLGTDNSGGGGGSGGVVTNPTGNADDALKDVLAKLTDMLEDKGNGLAKAVAAIQEALRNASVVDLSKNVKVEGDKATPTLDAAKLSDLFKSIKELTASANKDLKTAGVGKTVKAVAALDLGTVSAKEISIPLSKEVLEAAKANGIEAIALKVNGVELTIDVDQLGTGTNVSIKKQDKSVVPSDVETASDVYDFTFESNGSDVGSNFDKPVEVRLPVVLGNLDSELLVFAKIEDGKLIFKGGKYDPEKKAFVVANKSFSTYAIVENNISFTDTSIVKDWAGRQISVAAAKGILEGREEGQFVPNGKVTRAEFAKMIVKTFGLEDSKATEGFADVDTSDWFQTYVAAAAKAGIIEGRTATSFEPNATITRAEMATMAARALKLKDYQAVEASDKTLAAFQDAAAIHATLKDGVALAAEQGIVVGEENGFNPNNDATRAQAAVVIYRLLNK